MYNNLKILIRNLYRNALYTWINIIGLAVSLTAAIFILLWVQDEWSYDKFYDRSDNIYMLYSHSIINNQETYGEIFPKPLAQAVRDELAEVEAATIMGYPWGFQYVEYEGSKYFNQESGFKIVDTCFFNVFDMPFIEGNAKQAFENSHSVVITRNFAHTIFGNESALGKQLKGSNGESYFVSAVVENPPQNTMIRFSCLIPFEGGGRETAWNISSFKLFVLLYPKANAEELAQKIMQVHKSHFSGLRDTYPHILQPITKSHLYAADGSETGMKNLRLFVIVAITLLIIASINYVNLVTARAGKRVREIALRKIVGASKLQLFIQMIGETVLMLIISFCIATILLYFLTPYYSLLTGKQLVFSMLNPTVLLLYSMCFLFVVVLAGVYPASLIASFNPLSIFRSKESGGRSHISFRSVLIVLQFTCSVVFILATIVMGRQHQFMQTKNLGYNREHIFTVELAGDNEEKLYETFKHELTQQSSIVGVAASTQNILEIGNYFNYTWNGLPEEPNLRIAFFGVDRDFFDLLDIQFVDGMGYSGTMADSLCIFVNEEAVKKMGIENDPLSTTFIAGGGTISGRITGVVKDFHFKHMKEPIEPLVLYLPPTADLWTLYVKTAAGKAQEAIAAAERTSKKYEPEYPFVYKFMDETFDTIYREDTRTSNLFNAFAIVAIFISCLGLFGLATYTAETRTKEIGIRKTLGASVSNIVSMLSKEFVVLVGIAVAIGIPVAYYFMEKMLQTYAYRISITWWMVFTAILVVLALVVLTVSAQALRAARSNPVKAIKTE